MDKYAIYCTLEQTEKAFDLGAPLRTLSYDPPVPPPTGWAIYKHNCCKPPTAEEMIGYLRIRGFKFSFDDIYNYWAVLYDLKIINKGNSNNKELAAIDAALEYLSHGNCN